MVLADGGATQPRGAGLDFAGGLRLDEREQFLVGIESVGADVHHEGAQVGNHVVLRSGIDLCDRHLDGAEEVRNFLEPLVPEPFDGRKRLIDRVYAALPGCMAGDPGDGAVQDHQPFFGHDHFQGGRLSEHAAGDRPAGGLDFGQRDFQPVAAAGFFLGGERQHQRIGLRPRNQLPIRFDERHDGRSVVIGPQSVQPSALHRGRERIPCPARDRFHRVDVGIHQDGGAGAGGAPEVVAAAVRLQPLVREPSLQEIGHGLFVPAQRRDGDHPLQQVRHNSSSSCRL